MRVLFVSLVFPLPANNGHTMRTLAMLQALAMAGHKTTLLAFSTKGDHASAPELAQLCAAIETIPLAAESMTASANYWGRLQGIFSRLPYAVQRFYSPEMAERISAHLQSGLFDVVVSETIFPVRNIPPTRTPIVIDQHNVEHVIFSRYAQLQKNPAKRLYATVEAARLRREERWCCSRAAVVLCCSQLDSREVQRLCPTTLVQVAPNVVDVDSYQPERSLEQASVVLYQGGMDWFPNRDAVEFFVNEIFPIIRREVPGLRFVIAGRSPTPEFRRRFAPFSDVEFTGTLPDLRPVIARAAVCVVPLRIGSGTRLKILEAAAMGKAVVSTALGAEGLEFRHGEEILLAEDPRGFAKSTALLLNRPDLRRALGEAARKRVEQSYSLSSLRAMIAEVLPSVLAASKMEHNWLVM